MSKDKETLSKIGKRGENEATRIIMEYAPENAHFYRNRVLGGGAENDLIMTSDYGVLGFDFKTWAGSTFGNGRNYRVVNVNTKTGQKQTFYNPSKQAESHAAVDKRVLGLDHNKFKTVIVDLNGNINIRNSSCDVVPLDQLPAYMEGLKSGMPVMSKPNLHRVDNVIYNENKDSKNNRQAYVEKLK